MVVSQRFDDLGADGKPARLGILGGTFDPIHVGHLALAEAALHKLSLDAVLFIPTGTPVFKKDIFVTPADIRLEMVRRSVCSNASFDVSSIEIDRGGDTYTVDTLRDLREHYPTNVSLHFIVGADSAAELWKWKDACQIARFATIAVAERPGSRFGEEECQRDLAAAPFVFEFVEAPSIDVASRVIRDMAAAGKSIRYLLPPEAYAMVNERGLYRGGSAEPCSRVFDNGELGLVASDADPLSQEFIAARTAQLEARVKPKRFRHTMGVARTSAELAHAYGVDPDRAYLAGLLHDWDKGYDDEGIRQRARLFCVQADPQLFDEMPQLLHGPVAAAALACAYPQIPGEILQAIARHTAGAVDMTDLDMVVYVADAIEPNRDYPGVKELREAVGAVPLRELFIRTFAHTLENLLDRRCAVHPQTIGIWNSFASFEQRKAEKHGGKGK